MRLVIALGGNALLRRGEPLEIDRQRRAAAQAAQALAAVAGAHQLILTHGNGPQIGLLALQSESYPAVRPYPLDVLGAASEGLIGYLLEAELRRALIGREVATLLTHVVVDAADPAFQRPTKPIGPVYTAEVAQRLAAERGWTVGPDGSHWRRLVPSPEPRRIAQLPSIALLLEAKVIVICAGGGGIPIVADDANDWQGAEAVIDKDLAAALLATALRAEGLLLLTDVDAVYHAWGSPTASPIRAATAAELRALELPAGSMGPKVEAASRFVAAGGQLAAIGALGDVAAILAGTAGTRILPD